MKKFILSVFTLTLVFSIVAQDAADKKFQGGLVAGFGLNFQNMGTKNIEKNGVGTDLLIGGNMNIMFNETIGLTTGVEFDFSTTKFKTGANQVYYYYDDTKIIGIQDYAYVQNNEATTNVFRLNERSQKTTYLSIPTMLLFRTKFIGYVRYFGKFGMRHSFLLNQKWNDKGASLPFSEFGVNDNFTAFDHKNMKASNEVFFYKGTIGIAGGAEWNFTGSTCLVAEIGYYYGITPLYWNRDNSYMFNQDANGIIQKVNNKATQGQLQLKVSVLF